MLRTDLPYFTIAEIWCRLVQIDLSKYRTLTTQAQEEVKEYRSSESLIGLISLRNNRLREPATPADGLPLWLTGTLGFGGTIHE